MQPRTTRVQMFLLDTNVLSELRPVRLHGAVLAWIEGMADHDLHLSAVTLGEIQAGIEITRERDSAKAAEIDAWADEVAATWNVIALDARIFRLWAMLMHRRSDASYEDAMIAATARVHALTVVTRNLGDFRVSGVTLLDPFTAQACSPVIPKGKPE